jgi:hypothetical protein
LADQQVALGLGHQQGGAGSDIERRARAGRRSLG